MYIIKFGMPYTIQDNYAIFFGLSTLAFKIFCHLVTYCSFIASGLPLELFSMSKATFPTVPTLEGK